MTMRWRRWKARPRVPVAAARPLDAELADVREVWEDHARSDPLWAILSEPDKRGGRWELDAFLEEGRSEISRVMERVQRFEPGLTRGRAVDFGCGIGRLSQPLAEYFAEVIGVDISPTMIGIAQRLDRSAGRVRYVENNSHDLTLIADTSVDFVYCNIVLQHVGTDLARAYLAEFFRITRPGGLIVFQMPSHYSESYLPSDADESPLPARACRAQIHLSDGVDALVAGSAAEVSVIVQNTSSIAWRQAAVRQLNVGNHWLSAEGEMLVADDGRARLPAVLVPGDQAELVLLVRAPERLGAYRLVIDVVQEGVQWFADAGSDALCVEVRVDDPPAGSEATSVDPALRDLVDPTASPRPFSMAGIPVAEMEQLIRDRGGEMLAKDEYVTEWHSFTYYVRRIA